MVGQFSSNFWNNNLVLKIKKCQSIVFFSLSNFAPQFYRFYACFDVEKDCLSQYMYILYWFWSTAAKEIFWLDEKDKNLDYAGVALVSYSYTPLSNYFLQTFADKLYILTPEPHMYMALLLLSPIANIFSWSVKFFRMCIKRKRSCNLLWKSNKQNPPLSIKR